MSITPQIDFSTALTGLFDLRGKIAYVPGGYGGIGEAIAWGLAMAGARVAVSGRDEAKAEAVAAALRAAGHEALGLAMDAHSVPQMQASVDVVAAQWGGLDILMNCVGMQREQALLEVTEEAFDEVLQVNLKAAMFLAQAAARKQIEGGKGGAQVHLLSVRAQLGLRGRGYSAYSSSKGGLVMLIRQHASELAPHGITVNGIAPTVVQTEMARHWLENPETRKQVLERIPLGRVADPQDVAGAAVFFAAPASRFVTGQVLYLDGGITASQ
ncbi:MULTISPECIES: SDR family NAD(P)-dependent oxidoreductase [unclassified Polaromonas]|uniref:SDR family NAD(P)-dependent oxidoreductase n=1 Tax=unclassified Polaromonas TaxID=2638319 RepID=UPI000F0787E1|nr:MULTISPECIES: SDR family oxidoreductase [unclassified Polaromonas]AYQ27675.1 SDR family NAD(P)-dependent oxidoreductase [Polaromonas sp. SP1]QGJ17476.1 SDR family oxidoreductase [Polaromonas sp. Pch-P]